MKQITCEMCGSTELVKQDGFFVCQICGIKYSVEEAKKMMIEGTVDVQGTVKVDNTTNIESYLANARRSLQKEDWDEVEKYYNLVEQYSPNNIEAVFFSAFGKAMTSVVDTDYHKREQKFAVLERSISIISDCYEITTENKEEVIKKIHMYIKKLCHAEFVYAKYEIGIDATKNFNNTLGSLFWNADVLNSVVKKFVVELKQIAEKHPEDYLFTLINEYGNKNLVFSRANINFGSLIKYKVRLSIGGVEYTLPNGSQESVSLPLGSYAAVVYVSILGKITNSSSIHIPLTDNSTIQITPSPEDNLIHLKLI